MERKSNIELIRIVSMLMIVFHHYSAHSGWIYPAEFSKREFFIRSIGIFGKVGVTLFLLITGYFLGKANFRPSKLFNLWAHIFFYSSSIFIIFSSFTDMNVESLKWSSFFPISLSSYWFLSFFFFLQFSLPALKSVVSKVDKKMILIYVVTILTLLRLPAIIAILTKSPIRFYIGDYFLFILTALAGYLISVYQVELVTILKPWVNLCFSVTLTILVLSPWLINKFTEITKLPLGMFFLADQSSLISIIFSVSLFALFLRVTISSKIINAISSCTLGIYLIHDNTIIRQFIWKDFFKNSEHFSDSTLIFRSLMQPLLVFFVCLVIEFIRKQVVGLLRNAISSKRSQLAEK
ncbi:acyltransferase family protein [Vagococcus sp. BWB3-3]|uniref:Acyltransferase family protein n=1 Tax=Vagococcus allomyrinae TaxID=2794353 RepID=A0A940SXT6_9ENTE|nr:acyltransferase family protein [Vagococcus allomyrinae]MBP1043661.1 acyltransferase family protein [Vagococcus allomyrinae]